MNKLLSNLFLTVFLINCALTDNVMTDTQIVLNDMCANDGGPCINVDLSGELSTAVPLPNPDNSNFNGVPDDVKTFVVATKKLHFKSLMKTGSCAGGVCYKRYVAADDADFASVKAENSTFFNYLVARSNGKTSIGTGGAKPKNYFSRMLII